MKSKKFLSLALALVMSLSLAAPVMAAEEETPVQADAYTVPADAADSVVILHSNDVHGAVDGYAKMAALKAMYEAAGAEVFVLDAGDFIQGDPVVSVSQGKTAVELMGLAGYVAAAPGNHELDYGYENLTELSEAASFPILCANIVDENGEAVFVPGMVLVSKLGNIGVFGLNTPETATKAHPAKIKGLTFLGGEELYKCAEAQVKGLKDEGVDVIVALAHLGIDEESAVNGNRSVDLLEKVSGIDVLIDGHSHSTEDKIAEATNAQRKVGDTVITSTGTKFANIGVITIKADGAITTECVSTEVIPVAEDDPVLVRAKAIKAEVEADYGEAFAVSEVKLEGEKAPGNRTQETNNGDLICDAMLWLATKEDLGVATENVIAITNGGGIRAAIETGNVTKKAVNTVLPFGNTVAVAYVTGETLLETLEASTFCTPEAVGGFPQVSGIEFTVDARLAYDAGENYPGTTYAKPNSISRVTITGVNGKDFDPEATYAVVTNDFVAAGGDTYYALSASEKITDTGVPLDEAVMQYITEVLGGTIPAEKYGESAGRITIVAYPTDMVRGEWWFDAAANVYDKGLMTSTGNGFAPNAVVTRATVVQTLWNLEGRPAQDNRMATFPDAQGTWYEQAVRWAEQAGVVEGTGSGFNGDREITRAELVTMLYRYVQAKGNGFTGQWMFLLDFEDAADVPNWADEAMHWCVMNKVVSGKNGNRLAPSDTASRAELAQILTNYTAIPAADEDVSDAA